MVSMDTALYWVWYVDILQNSISPQALKLYPSQMDQSSANDMEIQYIYTNPLYQAIVMVSVIWRTGCMDDMWSDSKFNISSTTQAKSKPKGSMRELDIPSFNICIQFSDISKGIGSPYTWNAAAMTATTATTPTQTMIDYIFWTTKSCRSTASTRFCSSFEEGSIDLSTAFAAVVFLKETTKQRTIQLNLIEFEWNERTHCWGAAPEVQEGPMTCWTVCLLQTTQLCLEIERSQTFDISKIAFYKTILFLLLQQSYK